MKGKITKGLVDRTSADQKPIIVFDTDVAGFALKVLPSGSKIFQLRYRMGGRDTPKRTLTLGSYGVLTPEQARRQAQILLGDIRRGVDPASEKAKRVAEERGALTLSMVASEFMELHTKAKRKSRTFIEYDRLLAKMILPKFGDRPIKKVFAGEIERWHHDMRATPYQANRALAVLSKLIGWAIARGYREGDNPCRAVEKFKEVPRRRYLSPVEIAKVGDAIRNCETDSTITSIAAAFFRLLLLTGMRKDELRLLTWDRVNLERQVLVLGDTDAKTGWREVPLSAPAGEILVGLPQLGGNPFVFPGKLTGRPLVNVSKAWRRVLARAGVDPTRIHDLRHTVGSIGVTTGASLLLIGGVLGHKSQATTQRYAHLADDPVRATVDAIGESISAALGGRSRQALPQGDDN